MEKLKLYSVDGRYPRYRNRAGAGIYKETCGCQIIYWQDGSGLSCTCKGHGGGVREITHSEDIDTWPTFEEAVRRQAASSK
jgi:hypothetical protein